MWHHMATQIWDNIGTANGIAITWINVDLSLARCCSIHLRLQPHLTKGQECGNLFHIMTLSCSQFAVTIHHLYGAEKYNKIIIKKKKSDVKHWNTLSCLDQYMAPNSNKKINWWLGLLNPHTNRELKWGILHIMSKFSPSSLNGWWVIACRLTHTHTQMQAMTIPEGQNWPWIKTKH